MKKINHNFLINQYKVTNNPKINHNYLRYQFNNIEPILKDIQKLVQRSDFTLGEEVNYIENKFKKITNSKYAIGVGSGTDAIKLSLKSLGIKKGDEILTSPYTFYGTIGAIVALEAIPVFVDISDDYNIDVNKIESKITKKSKAILPVHWSGLICDMKKIKKIADKYNLFIVEDACHAILASRDKKRAGFYSHAACYSMHPLKNLNVWGDGGIITTNSKKMHDNLVLERNHGLIDRNICKIFASNSRLDTIQAIVAKHSIKNINKITSKRIFNSQYLDKKLSLNTEISIPIRSKTCKQVFHIYVIKALRRNALQKYLIKKGIDAKIHYPIPMHLQPAAKKYGYKLGDFPITEQTCKKIISLPVHEFINKKQLDYMIKTIKEFYN